MMKSQKCFFFSKSL